MDDCIKDQFDPEEITRWIEDKKKREAIRKEGIESLRITQKYSRVMVGIQALKDMLIFLVLHILIWYGLIFGIPIYIFVIMDWTMGDFPWAIYSLWFLVFGMFYFGGVVPDISKNFKEWGKRIHAARHLMEVDIEIETEYKD